MEEADANLGTASGWLRTGRRGSTWEPALDPASRAGRPGLEPKHRSAKGETATPAVDVTLAEDARSPRHDEVGKPVENRGNMAQRSGGGTHRREPREHARDAKRSQRLTTRRPPHTHSRTHPHAEVRCAYARASCAYDRRPSWATAVPPNNLTGRATRGTSAASCFRRRANTLVLIATAGARPASSHRRRGPHSTIRQLLANNAKAIRAGSAGGNLSA